MLRRYTWKKVKAECQPYRRRRPEKSTLYQVVYHNREELEYGWEERYQHQYGVLRDSVLKALDEYLNCGLLEHGAARVHCDTCDKSILVAFSCKKRGICPSCSTKRAVRFAEHISDVVLKDDHIPLHHMVFSIPKRLRSYFRYNRRLCSILFQSAWGVLEEVYSTDIAEPGAVLTLQTAGEALNWNPHLHGMGTAGVFRKDTGEFLKMNTPGTEYLTERFATLVLAKLCKQDLLTDDITSQILSQQHSGFSVWIGDPFQDKDSERFVAKYVERGPVSLEKLALDETSGKLLYTMKDHTVHEHDPLDFLALLTSHIPNTYESITRYYGWYSCRARGERKKAALLQTHTEKQQHEPINDEDTTPSSWWVRCIKRVYEVNPLECPNCKSQMRIISFMQDPLEIKKIMKSQGIAQSRPPPQIHTPADEQLFFDDIPDYDA